MYVNCSHGKGIQFIRNELKFFAKTNINTHKGLFSKSIVLFNADKLTTDAQSALRRCIEQFSNSTSFSLWPIKRTNVEPILSRFGKIFVPLSLETNKIETPFDEALNNYKNNRMNWLQKNILKYDKEKGKVKQNKIMIEFAEKIYNKGYSALDLMVIMQNLRMDKKNKLHYLLFFAQKIKKNLGMKNF